MFSTQRYTCLSNAWPLFTVFTCSMLGHRNTINWSQLGGTFTGFWHPTDWVWCFKMAESKQWSWTAPNSLLIMSTNLVLNLKNSWLIFKLWQYYTVMGIWLQNFDIGNTLKVKYWKYLTQAIKSLEVQAVQTCHNEQTLPPRVRTIGTNFKN